MINGDSNINYSLADIERYLQGKMSAAEMHELEKEALQDAFLSDAIEGYRNASLQTSHQHLEEIEQLISGEKEATKIVPFTASNMMVWKIAASVITVAVIGIVFWLINPKQTNKNTVAEIKPAVIEKKDSSFAKAETKTYTVKPLIATINQNKKPVITNKDIVANEINKLLKDKTESAPTKQGESNLTHESIIPLTDDKVVASNEVAAMKKIAALPIQNEQNALSGRVAGISVTSKNKNILGRITDTKGNPVSYASVLYKNDKAVAADANGYFTIHANDTALNSTINAIGYTAANTKLSNHRFNNIILNENTQSLNDVVVIGYGTQRKKDVTGSVSVVKPTIDTLMPEGGWDNYKTYLVNKIKSNTAGYEITGDIEFEFKLDKDGQPVKVRVLKSPDKTINKQLIEAIKQGPKWHEGSKKEKKQKAVIKL